MGFIPLVKYWFVSQE